MTYSKLNFKDNQPPALSAENMNHIEDGIENAHTRIDELSLGETPKGSFTPTDGAEYPLTPTIGDSYYISGVDSNGYLYTGGDLVGQTANNMDKIIYSSIGWTLVENNSNAVVSNKSFGNLSSPILDMPLKDNLDYDIGSGTATFTRDTTATYIDKYGVLKYASINEPRFEKDGLLIEGASTNEALYSSNIAQTNSTLFSATEDSTTELAPDGTNTATQFTNTSDNGGYFDTVTVSTASETHTLSCYYKKGVGLKPKLLIRDTETSANNGSAIFDMDTMSVESTNVAGTYSNVSAKIEEDIINNDYVRCSLTLTLGLNVSIRIYTYSSLTNGLTYTLWGRQIEALPFATSYIPTTTASVTRSADACSVTFKDNVPQMQSGSTFLMDFDLIGHLNTASGANNRQHLFHTTLLSYLSMFYYHPNTTMNYFNGDSSGDYSLATINTINTNTTHRTLMTKQDTTLTTYFDGVQSGQKTVNEDDVINGDESIILGSVGTSRYLFGHIKNFKIYDYALTSEEARIG